MPIVAIERKKIAQYETPTHPAPASPMVAKRQAVIMCHLRSCRLSDENPQASRPIVPTRNGMADRTPVAKVERPSCFTIWGRKKNRPYFEVTVARYMMHRTRTRLSSTAFHSVILGCDRS